MRESTIERYFVSRIQRLGGMALKLNSSSGCGLPDRMVLMPGGRIYFVELKAPGRKPRPVQKAVHSMFRNMGVKVFVIDTKEKVGEFINEIQTT